MARTAVGQITYFDVSDGLVGPQGPAGPATLSRYRTATNAATAGRPLTDSGIDGNWTDNPDLVDGQTGDTIFVSNQFANITQSGNPYQTTIAGTGTSGAVWVPARPEVATIEVAADAMSSSRDPGVMESARFQISGNPGNAVEPTRATLTFTATGLPSTITFDVTQADGGADISFSNTVARTNTDGNTLSSGSIVTPGARDTLEDYAVDNSVNDGVIIDTLDYFEYFFEVGATLAGSVGFSNGTITSFTRGTNSFTAVFTQDASDVEGVLWTGITTSNSRIDFSGVNASIGSVVIDIAFSASVARVLGGEITATIPYVDATGTQQTLTSPLIRFQSSDTTSALLAQRFVDNFPTETTITNAIDAFSTSWSLSYNFSIFGSDAEEAIFNAVVQAGYQRDDEIIFTSDTGSGTYTISRIEVTSVSLVATAAGFDVGTPSDTMTFPYRIIGQDFTVTRDGSEVVVTGLRVGNVTGSYSFSISQNTGSAIVVSSPIITEGAGADTPSEVTIRTFTEAGTEVDTTVMFAANLDATQIAAQIATEWPGVVSAGSVVQRRELVYRTSISFNPGEVYFLPAGLSTWPTNNDVAAGGFVEVNFTLSAISSDFKTLLDAINAADSQADFNFEITDGTNSAVYSILGIDEPIEDSYRVGFVSLLSSTGVPPADGAPVDLRLLAARTSSGTGYLATANGRTVTLTGDNDGPRTDTSIPMVLAGTTGNLAGTVTTTLVNGAALTLSPTSTTDNDSVYFGTDNLNMFPVNADITVITTIADVVTGLTTVVNNVTGTNEYTIAVGSLDNFSIGNYTITAATRNSDTFTLTATLTSVEPNANSPFPPNSGPVLVSVVEIDRSMQTFTLSTVDGVAFETDFTGTRSTVSFANGSQSISLDIPPATNLNTELQAEVLDNLNFNDIDMYELPVSLGSFQLQSQSRALGADQTVDVTFNAGDSSDASIFKLNESAGQNQVTDAVINGWSFARTDSTIG